MWQTSHGVKAVSRDVCEILQVTYMVCYTCIFTKFNYLGPQSSATQCQSQTCMKRQPGTVRASGHNPLPSDINIRKNCKSAPIQRKAVNTE